MNFLKNTSKISTFQVKALRREVSDIYIFNILHIIIIQYLHGCFN